ncbi:hypothetical protein [Nocardia sp. NBC_00403]|uniref:hypothetical protein n=1 Tax=Nocardia sp. NBC_00403 TaxID=2975990 RepID=UPI002E232541
MSERKQPTRTSYLPRSTPTPRPLCSWRRAVNAGYLVALVRAEAVFEKGKLVERPVDPSDVKEAT